jgi:hypothetical protein
MLIYNSKCKSDIDIVITKDFLPIYIEVKHISNQTNNHNQMRMVQQHQKHLELIENKFPPFIIFIDDMKNTKLPENAVLELKNINPNINIFYNTIERLPVVTKFKKIVLTREFLGVMVSEMIPDFLNNLCLKFLHKYQLYVDEDIFNTFDKRMDASRSECERERWSKFKSRLNIFKETKIVDFMLVESKRILKAQLKSICYAYTNNAIIFLINSAKTIKDKNIFMRYMIFYGLPIYGSTEYNLIQNYNTLYKSFYYAYLYVIFIINMFKIIFI